MAEIQQRVLELPRRFGFFVELHDRDSIEQGVLTEELQRDLGKMESVGWVVRREERYALTPLGRAEADGRCWPRTQAGQAPHPMA